MEKMITPELEEKIKNAETLDDLVRVCAEEGIEVTKEQLEAELAKSQNGELNEDDLDQVSGGITPVLLYAALVVVCWASRRRR